MMNHRSNTREYMKASKNFSANVCKLRREKNAMSDAQYEKAIERISNYQDKLEAMGWSMKAKSEE